MWAAFLRLFGVKNEQCETITELPIVADQHWKVRVWMSHPTLAAAAAFDHVSLKDHIRREAERWLRFDPRTQHPFCVEVAAGVARFRGVTCVAITDIDGNGASYYPDWH